VLSSTLALSPPILLGSFDSRSGRLSRTEFLALYLSVVTSRVKTSPGVSAVHMQGLFLSRRRAVVRPCLMGAAVQMQGAGAVAWARQDAVIAAAPFACAVRLAVHGEHRSGG